MFLKTVQYQIELSQQLLDVGSAFSWLNDREGGGKVIFTGHVRENLASKKVLFLEFEAYEPMALKEMEKIACHALANWSLLKVVILHRLGRVEVGELPVLIGVTAAHLQAACNAAQYLIDTLKESIPIWKREYYEDGAVWVSAHP